MTDTISIIAKARAQADAARPAAIPAADDPRSVATDAVASATTVTTSSGVDPDGRGPAVVPLVTEEAVVSKTAVTTGRVRVRTLTEVFEELVREELETERVSVTRVPIDRIVSSAPSVRTDGDVTIIPVLEETLVVERRLLLKEEVHVRRERSREPVEETVPLRRQRAVVERTTERVLPAADAASESRSARSGVEGEKRGSA